MILHVYMVLSGGYLIKIWWCILDIYIYIYTYISIISEKMNTIVLVFVCIAAIIGLNFILGLILMCCFTGMFAVVVPKLSDLNEQNPV